MHRSIIDRLIIIINVRDRKEFGDIDILADNLLFKYIKIAFQSGGQHSILNFKNLYLTTFYPKFKKLYLFIFEIVN